MSAPPRAAGSERRHELVVFDCDGVLVDSERLAIRVEAEILAELGWPLTEAEIVERFVGRSSAHMRAEVERQLGRPLDWDAAFTHRYRAVFDAELVAVEGVVDVVDALVTRDVPICVASSSTHDAIAYKLARVGLTDAFGDHVFSAEDVANGKPAPDVFLHAARTLGVEPRSCAVIEDSEAGVAAGVAAGMTVYAFAGGVTSAARLAAPGVVVFDAMAALGPLLDESLAAR